MVATGPDHVLGSRVSCRHFHREPYDDMATRTPADARAWRPVGAGSAVSPYAVAASSGTVAFFSAVDLYAKERKPDFESVFKRGP